MFSDHASHKFMFHLRIDTEAANSDLKLSGREEFLGPSFGRHIRPTPSDDTDLYFDFELDLNNEYKNESKYSFSYASPKQRRESAIKDYFSRFRNIKQLMANLRHHSIAAAAFDALSIAAKLRALQKSKENLIKLAGEDDSFDPKLRETVLESVDEKFSSLARHFSVLKVTLASAINISSVPQGLAQEQSTLFSSSREFLEINLRYLIGLEDKEAESAFDELWSQLKATSFGELTKVVFKGNVSNPIKNKILQQVPILYRLAYQMEFQQLFADLSRDMHKSNQELESIVKKEREIVDEAEKLDKRMRVRIKLATLFATLCSAYEEFRNKAIALPGLIRNRSEKIAEAKTDDLDEMLRELKESKDRLLQDLDEKTGVFRGDLLQQDASVNQFTIESDAASLNTCFACLQTKETEFKSVCKDVEKSRQAFDTFQHQLDELQTVDLSTQSNVDLACRGLPPESEQYWLGITKELFNVQDERKQSFLQLQDQTTAIKVKRQQYDAEILARMKQSKLMSQPVVVSDEVKEEKVEYEVKEQPREDKEILAMPEADQEVLSQAATYAKNLLQTDAVMRQCNSAEDLFLQVCYPYGFVRKQLSLSWCVKELSSKVKVIDRDYLARPEEQIKRLKVRNEALVKYRTLHPQKPSGKPWLAAGIFLGLGLIAAICTVFIVSNPIGWGYGLAYLGFIGAVGALCKSYQFIKKGCRFEKQKTLLEANNKDEFLQALLQKQESDTKMESTDEVVRDRLIQEGMVAESVYPELFINPDLRHYHDGAERCAMLRKVRGVDVSDRSFRYGKNYSGISEPGLFSRNIPPTSAELDEKLVPGAAP